MKLYYPDSRVTVRRLFSLFVLSNYAISCQKKVASASSVSAFISSLNSMCVSFFNVLF